MTAECFRSSADARGRLVPRGGTPRGQPDQQQRQRLRAGGQGHPDTALPELACCTPVGGLGRPSLPALPCCVRGQVGPGSSESSPRSVWGVFPLINALFVLPELPRPLSWPGIAACSQALASGLPAASSIWPASRSPPEPPGAELSHRGPESPSLRQEMPVRAFCLEAGDFRALAMHCAIPPPPPDSPPSLL